MKKEPIQNYKEWLEQDPIFEGENKEVFENADGSQYIPIAIVESLLDQLTDYNWSTPTFDFESNELWENIEKDGISELACYILLCGTISLNIKYGGFERNIIGCAQKRITDFKSTDKKVKDNEDYKATMFSLALCNAAKKLGNRFGRILNSRGVLKVKEDKEKPSISELDLQIESVKKSMIEDGTYDNAIYLLSLYPNLKKNTTLKEIAESLPKTKK